MNSSKTNELLKDINTNVTTLTNIDTSTASSQDHLFTIRTNTADTLTQLTTINDSIGGNESLLQSIETKTTISNTLSRAALWYTCFAKESPRESV